MTVEAPDSPVEAQTEPPEGDVSGDPKGNREAARYRTERNEARAERDTLAQRVAALQTRELERIAGKTLSNPADLLTLTGKTVAEFVGEDGELDAELVAETAGDLLVSRPGLRVTAPAVDPTIGVGGRTGGKAVTDFGGLLKPD